MTTLPISNKGPKNCHEGLNAHRIETMVGGSRKQTFEFNHHVKNVDKARLRNQSFEMIFKNADIAGFRNHVLNTSHVDFCPGLITLPRREGGRGRGGQGYHPLTQFSRSLYSEKCSEFVCVDSPPVCEQKVRDTTPRRDSSSSVPSCLHWPYSHLQ